MNKKGAHLLLKVRAFLLLQDGARPRLRQPRCRDCSCSFCTFSCCGSGRNPAPRPPGAADAPGIPAEFPQFLIFPSLTSAFRHSPASALPFARALRYHPAAFS